MPDHVLWNGLRIEIIMVSGPVNAGKTLFGLTIDPNCRRTDTDPTTVIYDQEGSCSSYVRALNFIHKDTRAAVAQGVHNIVMKPEDSDPRWLRILKEQADCNDSPSASLFRAWLLSLIGLPQGKYAVIGCDTFTPLQEGLIDWLRRHPEAFGRTANEYGKASSMFLWPDVKSMLSHILAVECRTRCETFVMSLHLKPKWEGGQRTKQLVAEGLDVLEKLATLHLQLDRSPKEKGKDAPRVPSGILKKERLVQFGATAAEDRPILPPRLPECTPDAIRAYANNPPDFAKLKPAERVPEAAAMTEEERLTIQQQTAQFTAEAEQAKLSALEMARRAAQAGNAMVAATAAATPAATQSQPAPEQSRPPATQPATPAATQEKAAEVELATKHQVDEIIATMRKVFPSGEAAIEWLTQQEGNKSHPAMLTNLEADGVLSKLIAMEVEASQAANKTPDVTPEPVTPGGPEAKASQEQRDKIRELTQQLYGAEAANAQKLWLQKLGYGAAIAITNLQAIDRIAVLESMLNPKPVLTEGEIPF